MNREHWFWDEINLDNPLEEADAEALATWEREAYEWLEEDTPMAEPVQLFAGRMLALMAEVERLKRQIAG